MLLALRCFLKEFIARNKQHYLSTGFIASAASIDCYAVAEEVFYWLHITSFHVSE